MSAKCGTLKGFGFKKARPIDDGKIWKKKKNEIKKEDAVNQQFSFFFFFFFQYFPFYERKQFVC